MPISKRCFNYKAAVLIAFLILYLITTLTQADSWNYILSPLNALICAGILYFAYIKSNKASEIRFTLFLIAMGCFFWGIGDIILAAISLTGGDGANAPASQIMYVLTNCLFLVSLLIFSLHHFQKWDFVQFSIDLITSGFLTIVLFWFLFLHGDVLALDQLIQSDFTSILSIITDIFICISIFSWFLSVRSGKIPGFLIIMSFGLLLFALVDVLYYYLEYNGLYQPSSISDFLYIFSMVVISFGALWKTRVNSSALDLSILTNTGLRKRWIFLLLYPLIALFFSWFKIIDVSFSLDVFLKFMIPIVLYWAFCKYVQLSLEKEALLKRDNKLLEQRVAEQVSELTFLANQDTLTTLFNRRYFMSCLEETIRNKHSDEIIALLIIDLDRFKTINDTFGHDIGDRILIDMANRIITWNNFGATVARLGGDEFAVLFAGKYSQQDIENFSAEIIELCAKPFAIDDHTLILSMSIGIGISENTCDGKTLMQNADIAMYRAKSQGYNKYQIYNEFMSEDFKKATEIEFLLKHTQADKDFELFYQPQFALPGKKLIGAEALIRWNTPEHGFIPPNVFIPIAEQLDYVFKIGKWVLEETVMQSCTWNKQYKIPLKVGFNVSPKQFNDISFINLLRTLIRDRRVDPSWIDAEITESIMLSDADNTEYSFSVLNELGISVSVDDFGSGYSSLGYINRYSFDRIKIDKSLIDNLSLRNSKGVNVVGAAINMAHASGIKTIAEGVETQEQLDLLIKLGCDQVQGYLLGRPVTAATFEQRYIEACFEKSNNCEIAS